MITIHLSNLPFDTNPAEISKWFYKIMGITVATDRIRIPAIKRPGPHFGKQSPWAFVDMAGAEEARRALEFRVVIPGIEPTKPFMRGRRIFITLATPWVPKRTTERKEHERCI